MSNEKDTTNTPPKGRNARGVWFAFVAQADISEQMEVVHWIRQDPRYRVVTILHDRDIYEEDTEITRNDEKVMKHAGETKPAHYHGIIRVGAKITSLSLVKRFGGYLHFELLNDPGEYAHYMLHATFNARNKQPYYYGDLLDDVALWGEIADGEREHDVCGVVERVTSYRENGEISVDKMLAERDAIALRALISHSYFYATFVNKKSKKEEE